MSKKILFAGESWVATTTESKGFDDFSFTYYEEGFDVMRKVFAEIDVDVTYIPSHRVPYEFPSTIEELSKYDAVMFSDIGANTFLLHPDTFKYGKRTVNKLKLISFNSYVVYLAFLSIIFGTMVLDHI